MKDSNSARKKITFLPTEAGCLSKQWSQNKSKRLKWQYMWFIRKLNYWGFSWAAESGCGDANFQVFETLNNRSACCQLQSRTWGYEATQWQHPSNLLGVSQFLLTERHWVATLSKPQWPRGETLRVPAASKGRCGSPCVPLDGTADPHQPLMLSRQHRYNLCQNCFKYCFIPFSDMAASRCSYRKTYEKINMSFKGL